MSKKKKIIDIDYQFSIPQVIPATQEAFREGKHQGEIRVSEKENLELFRKKVSDTLKEDSKKLEQFPTKQEIFIFILQYFSSQKEYSSRDIDNMCKTILDLLRDLFYFDDSQVKTLIASKKIDERVPQNFAYIAIKELKNEKDTEILKIAGIERSVILYQELRSKGYFDKS